jgi:hypothetical protein
LTKSRNNFFSPSNLQSIRYHQEEEKNAWATINNNLQRTFSSLSSLSSSFSPFSTCRSTYIHMRHSHIRDVYLFVCLVYVCTRGVDTSSEGWSIDVLLTTVWVLFTSVIIVSVRNGFTRIYIYICASSIWISRDSQICVEQKKKKSSNPIVIFFSLRSQITDCPDDRRIDDLCRQDMKIKIQNIREWQYSCRYLFYFYRLKTKFPAESNNACQCISIVLIYCQKGNKLHINRRNDHLQESLLMTCKV